MMTVPEMVYDHEVRVRSLEAAMAWLLSRTTQIPVLEAIAIAAEASAVAQFNRPEGVAVLATEATLEAAMRSDTQKASAALHRKATEYARASEAWLQAEARAE